MTTARNLPDPVALADALAAITDEHRDVTARLVNLQLLDIVATAVRKNPAARYLTVWESEETLCMFASAVYDVAGHFLPDADPAYSDFAEQGQEWAWVRFVTEGHPISDLEGDHDVIDIHAVLDQVSANREAPR